MRDRYRYTGMGRRYVTDTRLPALVIGAITAWEGKRMTVVHVEERAEVDGGKWVVRLDPGDGGKSLALSASSVEATLPVFHEPFPACSCHGDPWPCNDAYGAIQRDRAEWREVEQAQRQCAACGQTKNLGGLRYMGGERLRFCRRVACVREAERRTREWHNQRHREQREAQEFAAQMNELLA